MTIAVLYPEPIRKREHRTRDKRLAERYRPRRRKKQEIKREDDGRNGMEADVRPETEIEFLGDHEFFVYGYKAAVESADEDLQWRCDGGEGILEAEQARG